MSEVFPENEHRHCVVHIGRNMVGRFKVKSLAALVYNAAKKTAKEECDRWLEEIKKRQVKEPLSTSTTLNTSYGAFFQSAL